jgi:NAD(P)-dependent dehydrogenase (short-subunit alcohol dehydrogenase family)
MKPDLSDKIILLTGGGRGLGRHAAQHLAACGAIMGVTDIDPETCRDTVTAIKSQGGKAHGYTGDMSDRGAFMSIAAEFAAITGRIDCVINNAMLLRYEPIEEVRTEIVDRMLGIGVKGAVWGAQALLQYYDSKRGGAIINMASPVVHRGYPNTAVYSAVKGAVVALTKVLAAELGPRGIRVNAVSPASVPTPGAIGMVSREEYARRAATIPLRRIGREEDNSNAIAFLLSAEASFINGEILNVDGGAAIS